VEAALRKQLKTYPGGAAAVSVYNNGEVYGLTGQLEQVINR
jgi:hypothetical protein